MNLLVGDPNSMYNFVGMSGGGGSGMVPPGIMSQQDFANLINQFVASGQNQPGSGPNVGGSANQNAPTFNGLPNVPPRPFSPLQGRPSSAPNMGGGMVKGNLCFSKMIYLCYTIMITKY